MFRSCPAGLGSEMGEVGGAFPPHRERTDSLTLVFGKDIQGFVTFLPDQDRRKASRYPASLAKSTGVHSSGHVVSVGRGRGRAHEGSKGVGGGLSEISLPKCVNIQYQISLNKKLSCCLLFDYKLDLYSKLCGQMFLYQFKLLLFSSQTGAKCKIFELTVSNCQSLVCS